MAGWNSIKKKYTWGRKSKWGAANDGILTSPGVRMSRPPKRVIWPWALLLLFLFCFVYYLIKGPPPPDSPAARSSSASDASSSVNKNQPLVAHHEIEQLLVAAEEMDGVDDLGLPKRETWILIHDFAKAPATFSNQAFSNKLKKTLAWLKNNQRAARIWPHNGSLQTLASQAQAVSIQSFSENEYTLIDSGGQPVFSFSFERGSMRMAAHQNNLTYCILSMTPGDPNAKPFQLACFHPSTAQHQPLLTLSASLLEEIEDDHASWLQPKEAVRIILENHLKWVEPKDASGTWLLRSEKQKIPLTPQPAEPMRMRLISREEKDALLKEWSDAKDQQEQAERETHLLTELINAYAALYDPHLPFYNLGERLLSLDISAMQERISLLNNMRYASKDNLSRLLNRLELQKLRKLSMLRNFESFQNANLRSRAETTVAHYAEYARHVLLEAEIEPEEFVNPKNALFFILADWPGIALKFAQPQFSAYGPLASQITENRLYILNTWNEIFAQPNLNTIHAFHETQSSFSLAGAQKKLDETNQTFLKLKEQQLNLENQVKETVENKLDAGDVILEWINSQNGTSLQVVLFEKE